MFKATYVIGSRKDSIEKTFDKEIDGEDSSQIRKTFKIMAIARENYKLKCYLCK